MDLTGPRGRPPEKCGPSYIEDGYTAHACCWDRSGRYELVRFAYRPLLVTDQAKITYRMEQERHNPEERIRIIASWIGEQIVSWTMKKRADGKPVDPRNMDDVLRIHSDQFMKIWQIILGEIPSDPDPDGTHNGEREAVVARTRGNDQLAREAAEAKN